MHGDRLAVQKHAEQRQRAVFANEKKASQVLAELEMLDGLFFARSHLKHAIAC